MTIPIPPVSRILLLLSGLITFSHAAPKNVLFIAVDDLKPSIGAYGDRLAKTPNIDRLAARGLLFESAYTSQALCAPSRNALFTGLRPTTLGLYNFEAHLRDALPNAVTLPQQFMRNGYRSEAVGKLFHVGRGLPDDRKSWSVPFLDPSAPVYALKESEAAADMTTREKRNQRGAFYESAEVADETYVDGKIATQVINRLKAAKARPDTPFFIAAGFHRPHLPFVAPKKYWDLHDPAKFKLAHFRTAPEGAPSASMRPNSELGIYRGIPSNGVVDEATQRKLMHGYYAAVSYTDAQVGKVIDALDRLGLAENTIIVLWGDHGWHLGDHGLWAKMTNFEEATRIPLIISAPGVTTRGSKTKSLVESIDIYPTLLELANLRRPNSTPKLEGKSLVPILRTPTASVNDHVLQVIPRQKLLGRSLRTSTHRLVEWKRPGAAAHTAKVELYNYSTDPEEKKNLAASQPKLVARLRQKLHAYPEAKPQFVRGRAGSAADPTIDLLFFNRDKEGQSEDRPEP
ncbi:sulfatase [Luteolibacter yonseiensis]|uniref:Sulfatase n=1 Tax=Luteolibacter yonseiensis TaxID=1144680 RepID=A0A934R4P6_9BACT|nr:sulfatase [Luteolibacter yonseiensis]MBK1817106.1 sulfatase [Luteolibacter yonseiensis]